MKYIINNINGETVYTSARTGRRLTGAAKVACEKAEAEREQRVINEIVENALILSWYEDNAIEIEAEQAKCAAIAKSYADARANAEEVKNVAKSFEEFCDALDAIIHDKKEETKKRIAITGWAFTETMLRNIETAYEDEDVKEALTHTFRIVTANFTRNALACMGWKYNADRGIKKGAVIDFLRKRDTEKFPIMTTAKYDIISTVTALQAINRCMIHAKKNSKTASITDKTTRPTLARLCRKFIQGMQTNAE